MRMRKQQIPWMMAAGRALLGPVLIAGEKCRWNGLVLAALIVTALLSDIFDGVLARRWKCDTAGVRLFDSMADTVFYGCVLLAMWTGMPTMWAAHEKGIAALLAMEAINHGLGLVKFGKPPSYHSYMAKTFGLVLATATVTVFATGHAGTLLTMAIAIGVASNVEGVAMSVMLPEWRRDVKTLAVAWRWRREMRPRKMAGLGAAAKTVALALVVLLALPVFALDPGQAKYAGGTISGLERDVEGKLDLTDPQGLVFIPQKGSRLAVPYDHIREYRQRDEKTHRLGALLTIAVALLGAREHTFTVSIDYKDAAGAPQLLTLEIPRSDVTVVGEVLQKHVSIVR